ncbi:hypothetical protein CO153_03755, partial [Candidatus Pacearchaeota archaeon CG_4_9_14_3_um_filter_30_11]
LVISIVTIAMTFTDLGIGTTGIRYISESLGKGNKKEGRSYARFFLKMKFALVLITIIILFAFSKYLSFSIYKNPFIYYPLIFSCFFIISESFREFFSGFFVIRKDLRPTVYFNLLLQISKISFSVLAILFLISEFEISGLFLAFFVSSFITLLISLYILLKKDKEFLLGKINKVDRFKINNYWKFMAIATLSIAFFGSIDTLMLGAFVSTEYLGYYRVSMSLILTVASLFPLSAIFLPIFTQIHQKRFIRGFQKTIRYILIFSIPATAGIIFISKHLIFLIYGSLYLPAISSFYFLSLLIITTPLIGLYSTILESKEKPKIVGNAVLISLVANVVLNYIAIKLFISNPLEVIAGVGFATAISRLLLLGILIFYSEKGLGIKIKGIGLRKPLLATLVMGIFLYTFSSYVDINLFTGIIEVLLGAIIYFGVLIWSNGLNKEDWTLLKGLIKKT